MEGFSIDGLLFWFALLCSASYIYLKIRKKNITFFKVVGLGALSYLILLVFALILFIGGDLF